MLPGIRLAFVLAAAIVARSCLTVPLGQPLRQLGHQHQPPVWLTPTCIRLATRAAKYQLVMKAVQDFDNRITSERKAFVLARDQELWTWQRLTFEVDRLSNGLIGLGIRPGDRVVMHMANLPEFVVAYLACFQIGAIAAPLNIRLKTAELEPLLQRLRPSLYIGQAALYNQIDAVDKSILGVRKGFVVDGPVGYRRSQPWPNLLGTINGAPETRIVDTTAPAL